MQHLTISQTASSKDMVRAVMAHFIITIPAFTRDSKAHNKCINSAETSHQITWEYKSNAQTCFVICGGMCKVGLF